ncbi:5-formyltetrahydrofolate cyclo-ligase [Parasalinivibrio latis]|uniref:5-formyltetrahydrofolate cyclo-ligase n=1 Tax=Parasalinivibrio latis TaxID=2952610 RepID=UPI0030DF4693
MPSQDLRQALRKDIRSRRRSLSQEQQIHAANMLCQRFISSPAFSGAQHIALYLPVDGELDTLPLIEACWRAGKNVYLPVIHPFSPGNLLFLHYRNDSQMVANRYGIPEPKLDIRDVLPPQQLDLIGTPLVAFDNRGQRLGMGGGYYDRTLAPWFATGMGARPVGIAHDCQQVDQLPSEIWDVPLPEIITPSRHWQWN